MIARCVILLSSSAQNNPARKSLNSSFFLPGEIISALHRNPASAQGTQTASCSDGSCSVQQQLSEAGVCERAGKRGASVCSHPFLMLPFFSPVFKKKKKRKLSFGSPQCSIRVLALGLWSRASCIFVLIAGFGTLTYV